MKIHILIYSRCNKKSERNRYLWRLTLKAKLVPLPSHQRLTHDKQLTLLTARTQYSGSSFLPKTIRDWNSLPMEVVEALTLDAFVSSQGLSLIHI